MPWPKIKIADILAVDAGHGHRRSIQVRLDLSHAKHHS